MKSKMFLEGVILLRFEINFTYNDYTFQFCDL